MSCLFEEPPSAILRTFLITEKVVRRLGAKTLQVGCSERVGLVVIDNYGCGDTVETYAEMRRQRDNLTPSKTIYGSLADELPDLQLADPYVFVIVPVEIRFDCDVYSKIIRNSVLGGTMGKPLARFSILGYLISGLSMAHITYNFYLYL